MYVINGKYKKTKLFFKINYKLGIRPISQMLKAAIFNKMINLYNFLPKDKTIFDIFSSSGQLGIECLSMEAKHVTFIDINIGCIQNIKKNLYKLTIPQTKYNLCKTNYKNIGNFLKNNIFDIIFLDPPFSFSIELMLLFIEKKLLSYVNDKSIIIYHFFLKDSKQIRKNKDFIIKKNSIIVFITKNNFNEIKKLLF